MIRKWSGIWEVSGSSSGHTKDFKNGSYCASAFAGHNELEYEECLSYTLYNGPPDKGGIIQRAGCLIR